METIAEMVEDEKTAAMLRATGVEYGQGYVFGKPSFEIDSFFAQKKPRDERLGEIIDVSQTSVRRRKEATAAKSPTRSRFPGLGKTGGLG